LIIDPHPLKGVRTLLYRRKLLSIIDEQNYRKINGASQGKINRTSNAGSLNIQITIAHSPFTILP